MSDTEEQKVCQVCTDFEPQTWRKSLCKNCFYTLEEHSAELLANEAVAVAKEKAAAEASDTSIEESTENTEAKDDTLKSKDDTGKEVKSTDNAPSGKVIKRKYGGGSAEGDGKWSWAKDVGREYGKPAKEPAKETSPAASATVPASTSKKSSPLTTTKPSGKSTSPTPVEVSQPSSSSSAIAATPDTTSVSVSKTKNFASKFESKASASTQNKATSKLPDIRPGSSTVAALTGKLTDAAHDSKPHSKLLSESVTEAQKQPTSKLDTKPPWKTAEKAKVPETAPSLSKMSSIKTKDGDITDSSKDKKSIPQTRRLEEKSAKPSVGVLSKAAPFGKDLLRSTKDSAKRDSSSADNKGTSSQSKFEALKSKELLKPASRDETSSTLLDKDKVVSTPNLVSEKSTEDKSKIFSDKCKIPDDKPKIHADIPKISENKPNVSEVKQKIPDDTQKAPVAVVDSKITANNQPTEIGQSLPSDASGLIDSASCSSRDSEHSEAGKINTFGLQAKSTGRISDVKTDASSEVAPNTGAATDSNDTICEGRRENGTPSLGNKLSDSLSLYRGKDKVEGEQTCDSAISISSSPAATVSESTITIPLSEDSKSSSVSLNSSTASDVQDSRIDLKSVQSSFKDDKNPKDKVDENETFFSSIKSSVLVPFNKDECEDNANENDKERTVADVKDDFDRLHDQLKGKDEKLSVLTQQLSKMDEQVKFLEEERDVLRRPSLQTQKEDLEKLLNELRSHLLKMEEQCSRLEKDNQALIDKLRAQEASVRRDQECRGVNSENIDLEEDLEMAEKELEDVKEDNKELQRHIMEMKNEMDEMYDHFRENEHDEFRELQKELDITGKNCRILQFKLRKAERRNDLIEKDRAQYEEKLRMLQDQFDSQDAKNHIKALEDELRVAKEVSVRLHDELDVVDDKRNKALEENRHLTELLEHTDKRQFRMEMEIDKLRDIVADLKQQLKETKAGNNNKESTPDRKLPLGAIGKQGSREHDVSQLMKDLCDCMERENDLKDQLKFTEEEAKMMRRRVSEMDEENENLRMHLQKMSEKASKHKKKEKERLKELEDERRQTDAFRAVISAQNSQDDGKGVFSDVILIVGPEGNDVMSGDEPVHISQRKDSTDEDLMNVMQMRLQLEMLEQELMTSHKKLDEMDLENENQQAEVKFLQERLAEKESVTVLPEPSTPNAYYEDKLREMAQVADELRWKLIEKDREMERMSAVQTRHSRDHGHKKGEKLQKSKSLEEADLMQADLRKQLEHAQGELIRTKKVMDEVSELNKELQTENEDLRNRIPIPSVHADDAAVENIELKENVRKLEDTNRCQVEKIKTLTENLQKLARDPRSYTSIATSPTIPGILNIPGIPLVGPGTQTARASKALPNPREDSSTRDLHAQLHELRNENEDLRRLMEELGGTGTSRGNTPTGTLVDTVQNIAPIYSEYPPGESKNAEARESLCREFVDNSNSKGNSNARGSDIQLGLNVEEGALNSLGFELSMFSSCQSVMDCERDTASTTTTTAKDGGEDKTTDSDDDEDSCEKNRTSKSKEESTRSILLDYPEAKSKVLISGTESRVQLMEKVLEMDDEIGDLLSMIKKREEECDRLRREVKYVTAQLKQVKDESRRTELDLLQELDMLHDKNSVMSNLLDIINERAEAAEEELERRMQEDPAHSPARSASNVSQVSALSDTSMGSDEVFLTAHVSKEGVITRDWETKLKVRIESLERLLAEERQKVTMAEKKLLLAGIDTISPSVSDDVKLRLREKELLQEELLKSQRHLHIATDQIQGLKERLHILEDEHERLKADYAKLYDEIDRPLDKDDGPSQNATDPVKASDEKTEEAPFVAKRISVVEAPKFRELRRLAEDTNGTTEEASKLEEELQKYKLKTKELEYKVEEINDIWRSKNAASDKEKADLEEQLNQKMNEVIVLEKTVCDLKREISAKEKISTENDAALKEKDRELMTFAEKVEGRDGEKRKHEEEERNLRAQVSQREDKIRGLNEAIRIRDERLKEKDDILCKLNIGIDGQKREIEKSNAKITLISTQLKEKEAEISKLRGQVSSSSIVARDMPPGCQTDVEKESFRLKEAVKRLQGELDRATGDKRALESNLEKSRKSLDETVLMWDKDRHSLQKEANILEEKVRMYETFNTMNRDEIIETLKVESQGYFKEKEVLICELSSLKLKHEAESRIHKEQVAKLQTELTEKLRLLKSEVDSNSHITTEMNRLKRQAEMAYRLQQEQRVFKAEHLATKVRYETRIDKLSKEHNKMLVSIDKLQKERTMDKQIINTIQKNLSLVKDSYTEELLRSQEDKTALRRYVKEIEESRAYLEELQKHIRDLRDKTMEQDRLRCDLVNKYATDRSSWEIEKANLNSKINQLDEKIFSSSRQQERSKDIQVNMGMAWEKERREQRRLLGEAHTLALDLQEQLRSRDEAFAHERKELLQEMESERMAWAKEKRESEREAMEMGSASRRMKALEKRLSEAQDKAESDMEAWLKEKAELVTLAGDARHAHARDVKMVEYVLTRLIRLRELGLMLTSQPNWDSIEERPPDRLENTDQSIVDFVKEAVLQLSQVADDLTMIANPASDEDSIKRISSSEIDLLKDEFSRLRHEVGDVVVVADVATSSFTTLTRLQEQPSGTSLRIPSDAATICSLNHLTALTESITKSTTHPVLTLPLSKSGLAETSTTSSSYTPHISPYVTLRPHNTTQSIRYDRPPSYTSGTRSAQSSRAATPEAPEHSHGISYAPASKRVGFPGPAPSLIIPLHKVSQTQQQKFLPSAASGHSSNGKGSPKRPAMFMKSLSMDSASIIDNEFSESHGMPHISSISASNTPMTSVDMTSSFSTPTVITSTAGHLLSVSRELSDRSSTLTYRDKVSPRTARRKFFENYPAAAPSSSAPMGYQSWPERKTTPPGLYVRQTSLPDPDEVRREAEEEHDIVSSKLETRGRHSVMKSSTSWDEQMHRKDLAADETSSTSAQMEGAPTSLPDGGQTGSRQTTAKDKRKLFKKATSLDSPIGSSIAKVGVAVMPPGAPTGFAPSQLFAAVKGKLKPVFKKKSTDSSSKTAEPRSPSPLFIQTDVPDIHFAGQGTGSLPVPAPYIEAAILSSDHQPGPDELMSDLPDDRSRDSHRNDVPRGKWRSKSADRPQTSPSVHADIIRAPPGVWQFNETAV